MSLRDRIRALFRIFFLFAVLIAVALLSAITTIRLTIHSGVEVLPDFAGMTLEQAEQAAAPQGLAIKVEDHLFSATLAAGKIISQVPAARTHIKAGQEVHVLVSLGAPQFAIPDVVGSTLRAARIMAIQRGLTIGDVAAVHQPGEISDVVVGQDPLASATELHSPAVNFLVSLGDFPEAYVCPDFVSHSLSDARSTLVKGGFELIQETPVPAAGAPQGTIIAQTPLPGSKITPDTVFNFQVGE